MTQNLAIRGTVSALIAGALITGPAIAAQAAPAPQPGTAQTTAAPTAPATSPAPSGGPAPAPAPSHTPTPTAPSTPAPVPVPIAVAAGQTSVKPGSTVTGSVTGLDPAQQATVTLVGVPAPEGTPPALPCPVIPAGTGPSFSCPVPAGAQEGTYLIRVSQTTSQGVTVTADSTQFYIVNADPYDPRVTGPGLPAGQGTIAVFNGTGYRPGATVEITTDSPDLTGAPATIDAQGHFSFPLPVGPFAAPAQHTITVTDPLTGQVNTASVYVLAATPALGLTVVTGPEGGYATAISGSGFAPGDYTVDLVLYSSDGSTAIGTLLPGVAVTGSTLGQTTLTIPAATKPGLYQVAAMHGGTRLAAVSVAVFPGQKIVPVTPATPLLPVAATVVVPPLASPVQAAPAPVLAAVLPFMHQTTLAQAGVPSLLSNASARVADLNASGPSLNAGGSLGLTKDPSPMVTAPSSAPLAAASPASQVQSDKDSWALVLVGAIATVFGLLTGYIIAAAGRRKKKEEQAPKHA